MSPKVGTDTPAKREKTPGSGRKKGTLNKSTADVRGLAQTYTADALQVLKSIMMSAAAPEAARVAAAREILDRAYGKPAQAHTGEGGQGPIQATLTVVHELHPDHA